MIGKIGVNGLYFVVRERSPFLVLRLMHAAAVATVILRTGCVRRLAWCGPRRSAAGQRQHDEKHGERSAPCLRGYEMPIHRRDRLDQLGSLFSTLPIRWLIGQHVVIRQIGREHRFSCAGSEGSSPSQAGQFFGPKITGARS